MVDLVALQEALEPPFVPLQVQDQGPVPDTVLAVPELQRLALGAEGKEPPFADQQVPGTPDHVMTVTQLLFVMLALNSEYTAQAAGGKSYDSSCLDTNE